METRIKERLIGAIALVAIVVIVVPELLTGPRPPAAAAPPTAPAPAVHTVTIDLAAGERGSIARVNPDPPASTSLPPARPAASVLPAAAAPAPASAPELAAAPLAAAATHPPPPPAATRPASAPAATPAVNPAATVAAAAAAQPAAGGADGWVVQLGSFASRENAERLANGLRARKYTAFVVEFRGSGRILYRVRVGPEQDRARAEAIAARLAREGHHGSVAPQP